MTNFLITIGIVVGAITVANAQSKKQAPQVKIIMSIDAPIDSAFNYIVPVDLSHIFKRYKRFPAVINTSIKGEWTKPGLVRTVFFDDGTTSKESLLTVVPRSSFSYKIENFTSQVRFLAKRIEGDWLFTELDNGKIKIEWTYKIIPKNSFTRFIIKRTILKDLEVLLTNALGVLKDDLESLNKK